VLDAAVLVRCVQYKTVSCCPEKKKKGHGHGFRLLFSPNLTLCPCKRTKGRLLSLGLVRKQVAVHGSRSLLPAWDMQTAGRQTGETHEKKVKLLKRLHPRFSWVEGNQSQSTSRNPSCMMWPIGESEAGLPADPRRGTMVLGTSCVHDQTKCVMVFLYRVRKQDALRDMHPGGTTRVNLPKHFFLHAR
jgi:hypothetical protein